MCATDFVYLFKKDIIHTSYRLMKVEVDIFFSER